MRKTNLVLVLAVSLSVLFAACEKTDDLTIKSVEGTYVGKLSTDIGLKSTIGIDDATTEVKETGNGQIEVHCFGGELDTTFMLNYFNNNDSVMVCLEGDAFESMYGHMMTGTGSMMSGSGGMMSGSGGMMGNGQTDWMNHMATNHEANDLHFGGFDMINNTFDYIIEGGDINYHFFGKRIEN
ncbi:MAG: hypothetical protein P1P88_04230 [Bacteroidales bacterium]|nr:hypothetical protein [Bacteroidales bacterium]